jgi:hypothetical protein
MDTNKIKNIVCLLGLVLIYQAGFSQSAEEVKIGERIWKIHNLTGVTSLKTPHLQ